MWRVVRTCLSEMSVPPQRWTHPAGVHLPADDIQGLDIAYWVTTGESEKSQNSFLSSPSLPP